MWPITPRSLLTDHERELLLVHFLALDPTDRRLRFGMAVTDDFITHYVSLALSDRHSEMFVIIVQDSVAAVCHVAVHDQQGELGVSVAAQHRGSGMASAMFQRAVSYLRVHCAKSVYMHCLSENRVMQHIARKHNMTVTTDMGDSDATLAVDSPTILTVCQENSANRLAMYDAVMRQHMTVFRRMWNMDQ